MKTLKNIHGYQPNKKAAENNVCRQIGCILVVCIRFDKFTLKKFLKIEPNKNILFTKRNKLFEF